MDVHAINSFASGTGKGKVSPSPRDGRFKCGGALFKETAMFTHPRKGNGKKGKQSKSWCKSAGKGKSKEGKGDGKSKGPSEGPKGATGSYKGKPQKLTYLVLKSRNQRPFQKLRNLHKRIPLTNSCTDNSWCDGGWSYDDWKNDWSSVGWHELGTNL